MIGSLGRLPCLGTNARVVVAGKLLKLFPAFKIDHDSSLSAIQSLFVPVYIIMAQCVHAIWLPYRLNMETTV